MAKRMRQRRLLAHEAESKKRKRFVEDGVPVLIERLVDRMPKERECMASIVFSCVLPRIW